MMTILLNGHDGDGQRAGGEAFLGPSMVEMIWLGNGDDDDDHDDDDDKDSPRSALDGQGSGSGSKRAAAAALFRSATGRHGAE